MTPSMEDSKAVKMLKASGEGGYGVVGVYSLETITAVVRAAESKKSPAQILLFPWDLHYSPLLIHLAAAACSTVKVPITPHMDHAQSEDEIVQVADYQFDSIMVDMSHYEKDEDLEKTVRITRMLHERGIATEVEPGRINKGDGGAMGGRGWIRDTGDLEVLLTTGEEASRFVATGIDFLAPAFGNVHGKYGGTENIKLQYDRYAAFKFCKAGFTREATKGKCSLVLHCTNTFRTKIMQKCIKGEENTGKVPLMELMGKGTDLIQQELEYKMDVMGSSGKASVVSCK
ncbi:ketose-bisphosphate aldolase [Calycina marina]|uniref:Fructose-bisphosphate aldolase n=1 Tax=Calycina marina TaxID=1763456 RepID=A0A9P7Z044_9HELO|nr:ketose-bisphosphate aldolase [Calycina marina]